MVPFWCTLTTTRPKHPHLVCSFATTLGLSRSTLQPTQAHRNTHARARAYTDTDRQTDRHTHTHTHTHPLSHCYGVFAIVQEAGVRRAFVAALQKEFDGWGLTFSIGGQARVVTERGC